MQIKNTKFHIVLLTKLSSPLTVFYFGGHDSYFTSEESDLAKMTFLLSESEFGHLYKMLLCIDSLCGLF